MIKNTANTDLLEWIGIECEFDSGQKWFESHPTTDICLNKVISLNYGEPHLARIIHESQTRSWDSPHNVL